MEPRNDKNAGQPELMPATLGQLALTFLKIGSIGFGGWMAMIALMEQDFVRRRRYIQADEFLHGVGLGQLVGSFSVNVAMFIGYRLFGPAGLVTAFVSFLTPSVVLILVLSWVYFTYHTIPALQAALAGIGPVVIALVFHAALSMARKAVRSWPAAGLAAVSCILNVLYVNPILILLGAGFVGWALKLARPGATTGNQRQGRAPIVLPVLGLKAKASVLALTGAAATGGPVSPGLLAWTFLKIGSVFFGGGFVLVPLMHRYMVEQLGWLTGREFLDGVAMSQITPGPIAILSTFAGFKIAGVVGGLIATMALYVPSIVLMVVVSHSYKQMRHLHGVQDFLAGVVPAVVGLVLAAVILLAPGNIHWTRPAGLVLALLAVWLFQRKWHPAYVLALGAAMGILLPAWFIVPGE